MLGEAGEGQVFDVGRRFDHYLLKSRLGQGAMGSVFLADDLELNRSVAVKVIREIGDDPSLVARFRREAQAIAHLRHPNVLVVFDFGEFEGSPYMVVEFAARGSLADLVKGGPRPASEAASLVEGIAAGLDYAHQQGIVHRDVKLANILLDAGGRPMIADFGLARLLEGTATRSSGVVGTPNSMAPEQIRGDEVGPPADIYSLGALAFELLTGRPPFEGDLTAVLHGHLTKRPPSVHALQPDIPAAVDAVLERALAKNPADRWPDATTFAAALAAAVRGEAAPSTIRLAIRRSTRSFRSWRTAGLVGLLLLATVGGSLAWVELAGSPLPVQGGLSPGSSPASSRPAFGSLSVHGSATPASGNYPLAVNFKANLSGGKAPFRYAWDFADNGSSESTDAAPSHTYTQPGRYGVVVTVTDAAGEQQKDAFYITVSSNLSAAAGANPAAIDLGAAVTFTGGGGGGTGGYGYLWDFGDGQHDPGQSPSHTYAAAGTYTAVLTVTDRQYGETAASQPITITVYPALVAAPSASQPSPGTGNLAVNFQSVPSGGTGSYTYAWDFGDATGTSTAANPSYTYAAAGSYAASLTLTDTTGGSVSEQVVVTVS